MPQLYYCPALVWFLKSLLKSSYDLQLPFMVDKLGSRRLQSDWRSGSTHPTCGVQ